LHAPAHVSVSDRDPDPDTTRNRYHRRTRMASTCASTATSTPALMMTRRSVPISISMRPLAGAAGTDGAGSVTTIARAKPDFCPSVPSRSLQNDRRQFSNSEREMPYRRAVDEIARAVSNALRNDFELLVIRPAPPPTGFHNAETFNLSTELIAVHKDCYTPLNLTRQGGPRRRETMNRCLLLQNQFLRTSLDQKNIRRSVPLILFKSGLGRCGLQAEPQRRF
jgi:hypothetical protein